MCQTGDDSIFASPRDWRQSRSIFYYVHPSFSVTCPRVTTTVPGALPARPAAADGSLPPSGANGEYIAWLRVTRDWNDALWDWIVCVTSTKLRNKGSSRAHAYCVPLGANFRMLPVVLWMRYSSNIESSPVSDTSHIFSAYDEVNDLIQQAGSVLNRWQFNICSQRAMDKS